MPEPAVNPASDARPASAPRDATGPVLAGCAAVLVGSFAVLAGLGDLAESARLFVGLFVLASAAYGTAVLRVVQKRPTGRAFLIGIAGAAVAFRLTLLPALPTLSTDIYRYLWDGRVAAAGISPYRYPASAPELAELRDATVYRRLNHADWRTIYPPGAQLLFAAIARAGPADVTVFKAVMVALDLLTFGLVLLWLRALGRPLAWGLVYAWHPLVVIEVAGHGHLEGAVLAATVAALWAAARGRDGWAGAFVGVAALLKLYPILLLAAVAGRRPVRTVATASAVVLAGYAVYAGEGLDALGSLPRYLAEESFNGGLRAALEGLLGPWGPAGRLAARLLPLAGLAAIALSCGLLARAVPAWRRAAWVAGAYLLTTPNLFPWYVLWLVPILAAAPAWGWLGFTCAVALSYLVLAQPVWHIPTWVSVAQFAPMVIALVLAHRPPARPADYSAPPSCRGYPTGQNEHNPMPPTGTPGGRDAWAPGEKHRSEWLRHRTARRTLPGGLLATCERRCPGLMSSELRGHTADCRPASHRRRNVGDPGRHPVALHMARSERPHRRRGRDHGVIAHRRGPRLGRVRKFEG